MAADFKHTHNDYIKINSSLSKMIINSRKYHNISYTIKFPSFKTRTFVGINEAKAYYIECMMDGGNINE